MENNPLLSNNDIEALIGYVENLCREECKVS